MENFSSRKPSASRVTPALNIGYRGCQGLFGGFSSEPAGATWQADGAGGTGRWPRKASLVRHGLHCRHHGPEIRNESGTLALQPAVHSFLTTEDQPWYHGGEALAKVGFRSESLHAQPAAAGQLQGRLHEELGVGFLLRELLKISSTSWTLCRPSILKSQAPAASPPARSALRRSFPSDSVTNSS